MALLTPLGSLPYPQPADAANIPVHMQSLAEAVDGRTVLRFADAATRDTKVTAPVAGMLCWLSTPKQYWFYTGSVWTQLAPGPVHKANSTAGTTTAASYVESLTGSTGDPTAVTFTAPASGAVLVALGARLSSSATGTSCFMSANVRQGTTVVLAAADARSAISTGTDQCSVSTQFQVTGLTPNGVYTATAAYKSSATTATATGAYRFVTVTPVN
ncbi:hypothetical protein [Streptomyces olivochromogenes]|uniref:Uncharacterized protein n=1 Tax=Streptomyces olivochromogenes TaxID=1963 RepID=A0A250VFZ2_STROL|nr:hypothetical protein [Streptomyces olivochromogenes]KUN44461.1 hypothetical protein AQJ27_27190 [Streptomyces olivochromogenes]GAX52986.1 hypothetical protein SO3561_04511 [Streptomyces olivochromogenes]